MRKFLHILAAVAMLFTSCSCGGGTEDPVDEPDNGTEELKITLDAQIKKKIIQDEAGVTAGDGMYSIALPDGRSIFLMGDSYTGKVTNGTRQNGDHMFRNTYHIYDNGKVSAITSPNNHSAAVPPGYEYNEAKWYWPGHGFVDGNTLYIFQLLMYQGADGMWGFRYQETHVLEYSLPDIKLIRDYRVPYYGTTEAVYGAAALNNGDYAYIYAQYEKADDDAYNPVSQALCARSTIANLGSKWEYWTGSDWSENSAEAKPMAGLSQMVISSQFNVFKLRGKYVLLSQHKQLWDGRIFTAISDTPYGPWRNVKQIFKVPELASSQWWAYNAMAHPQFETDGKILVSFCVNTPDFSEQFSNVECYRPRFFWYPIDHILN